KISLENKKWIEQQAENQGITVSAFTRKILQYAISKIRKDDGLIEEFKEVKNPEKKEKSKEERRWYDPIITL
ncbi:unnamed protein product, partial [marine sediment metagenome]